MDFNHRYSSSSRWPALPLARQRSVDPDTSSNTENLASLSTAAALATPASKSTTTATNTSNSPQANNDNRTDNTNNTKQPRSAAATARTILPDGDEIAVCLHVLDRVQQAVTASRDGSVPEAYRDVLTRVSSLQRDVERAVQETRHHDERRAERDKIRAARDEVLRRLEEERVRLASQSYVKLPRGVPQRITAEVLGEFGLDPQTTKLNLCLPRKKESRRKAKTTTTTESAATPMAAARAEATRRYREAKSLVPEGKRLGRCVVQGLWQDVLTEYGLPIDLPVPDFSRVHRAPRAAPKRVKLEPTLLIGGGENTAAATTMTEGEKTAPAETEGGVTE